MRKIAESRYKKPNHLEMPHANKAAVLGFRLGRISKSRKPPLSSPCLATCMGTVNTLGPLKASVSRRVCISSNSLSESSAAAS